MDQTHADLPQWPAPALTPQDFTRYGINRIRPMLGLLLAVLPQMLTRSTTNTVRRVTLRH
jgi:hypothetical protein